MNTNEILKTTGLDWNYRVEKVFTESGIELDRIGIVREDTNQILGVHSNGYVPFANDQLVELLQRVSSLTGLEIHKGGEFGGGKKVFVQLKSSDLKLGNDRVEGFVTGINSFDGSTSLAFGNSNLTISCQNTFFAAYRNLDKVRHTKNMNYKIDEICRGIDVLVEEEKQMFTTIKKMSETRFSQETKDRVIKTLFDIDMDIKLVGFNDSEELSTNTKNKLSRMYIDMNGEIQGKGDNVWGLFSGITKYTTHSLTKYDNTENKMFGTYGKRERQIFQDLAELV
jgi:phage/plasmid-like protein (TIGR03299 family)